MPNKQPLQKKKIPQRRCVGCGEHRDKAALVRVVRTPQGEVTLDRTGKLPGRGAYICPDTGCLEKAVKSRRLQTNLSVEIPPEIFAALQKRIAADGT